MVWSALKIYHKNTTQRGKEKKNKIKKINNENKVMVAGGNSGRGSRPHTFIKFTK